jgi:methionyl-tRNA synthetase
MINQEAQMTSKKKFQISTAIDYPSGKFHLGHAYEKICTDVIARWKRLEGFDVHFSTGTDCHGLKIQRAAEAAGKSPQKFVTEISNGFRELCKVLNISYDDFIMTTESRHKKVASEIVKQLEKNGDVYKGTYEGPYCVDCETFYTEKDLVDGKCPVHKKEVETLKEESYFFKMSKYQNNLVQSIKKNPELVWPEGNRKQILNRLKDPLKDLSISRANVQWGIPLPFDNKKTIFVWVEALINYLSSVGYPDKKFKEFWPAMHVIGTDIVWHHTAIWFSILNSIGVKLPRVVVHGFINLKGEKLSKARGVTVDPVELSKKYSPDALRYFLIREIPFGEDGDFSEEALVTRINGELVSDLGNLVSRVLTLVERYKGGDIRGKPELESALKLKLIQQKIDDLELHHALDGVWNLIRAANKYMNEKEPWRLDPEDPKLGEALYNLLETLRIISILVSPFLPETAEKINKQLGVPAGTLNDCKFGPWKGRPKKGKHLFERIK